MNRPTQANGQGNSVEGVADEEWELWNTFEVESTVSQVIAEKIIGANLGHPSYRIQLP